MTITRAIERVTWAIHTLMQREAGSMLFVHADPSLRRGRASSHAAHDIPLSPETLSSADCVLARSCGGYSALMRDGSRCAVEWFNAPRLSLDDLPL